MGKCKLCYFKCSNSFFDTQFSRGLLWISRDGMIEWGQKSTSGGGGGGGGQKQTPTPPPPKKKKRRVSKKTQTTLGTPKNFFCFIKNIRMTTSNCFEYAKNPHVNEKNPGTENFKPKIILQSPPSLEIRSTPPPRPTYLSR